MIAEYQNYTTDHPDLIPPTLAEANTRLAAIHDLAALGLVDDATFTRGWWALFWLNPGLHPDDHKVWPEELQHFAPLAIEAFRRSGVGELSDSLLYPADAAHNRIWRERYGIGDSQ